MFTKGSQTYKLIHSAIKTPPLVQEMTLQQLDKELYDSNLGMLLYSMHSGKLEASDLTTQQLGELQEVLGEFEEIFVIPSELPPPREHDHKISLMPGAKPPISNPTMVNCR